MKTSASCRPDDAVARRSPASAARFDRRYSERPSGGRHLRFRHQVPVAPWQITPGALAHTYDIPTADLRRGHGALWMPLVTVLAVASVARHIDFVGEFARYRLLMGAWAAAFLFAFYQLFIHWLDRPARAPAPPGLRVVVNVPCYNEDPEMLDRCLWSLVNQTRPPDRVDVVDDGSDKADYTHLRAYWEGRHGMTDITWLVKPNGGKRSAQVATFTDDPGASVFGTIDSDTVLERRALERCLRRFRDSKVQSVAGFELALNGRVNWLTRIVSARSMVFQLVACGTQSVHGEVLVNRGAFALYRAQLVRDHIDAYVHERFLRAPKIDLGDDAALTLFASRNGKAVQQSNAFAFTLYPENLSQHFRQWLRWMRGSTIRNTWRLRYLPLWSFGWWFTFINIVTYLMSLVLIPVCVAYWPTSRPFVEQTLVAMLGWSSMMCLTTVSVRRSDEGRLDRLLTALCFLAASLWTTVVLRPIRLWGMLTWHKQGWTTRKNKVEVRATPAVVLEAKSA
jgi:hyaluronan synthase